MKALSILLILLGFASCTYAETCPPEENLLPCICEEEEDTGNIVVSCSDEDLTLETLKRALNGISGKRDVDLLLSDINLGTVPSNIFYGVGIKKLELSYCNLDSLSDDGSPAFLGLESTLEELVITACFTEENVPASLKLDHLRRLTELELSYNAITELSDDWFGRGPASLKYLMISNNGIEKVGSRAFANLINLKQLSFDGNRFGPIQRSILPYPARNLETLELDNNALTGIPEDIFTAMPALSVLSLLSNGIVRLEQKTWRPVWQQLDVIRLEGNPIECDSHLNWMFELRRTSAIYGKCHSPRELEGESLQDLIDRRSRV